MQLWKIIGLGALLSASGIVSIGVAAESAPAIATTVNWLDHVPPGEQVGVSFGVPFAEGTVRKDQAFSLRTEDGTLLPTQSWPLAYWPDGSLKWRGIATVAGPSVKGPVSVVATDDGTQAGSQVKVSETADGVTIDTGNISAILSKSGRYLIDSLRVDGHEVARHGELQCIDQTEPDGDPLSVSPRVQYLSEIKKVTVEQAGPVRAVVKIEGVHRQAENASDGSAREWLPFVVRFYFLCRTDTDSPRAHDRF